MKGIKDYSGRLPCISAIRTLCRVAKRRGFGLAVFTLNDMIKNWCSGNCRFLLPVLERLEKPLVSWAFRRVKRDKIRSSEKKE